MDFFTWFTDTGISCLLFLAKLALIIIPLTLGVELLKHFHLLEKLNRPMRPFMKLLGLPEDAGFVLAGGLFLGMLYGGGILIESAEAGKLTRRHMTLLCLFLCLCHSVIEDQVLAMAIGAKALIILVIRLFIATLVVALAARLLREKPLICTYDSNKNSPQG